jgi:hypothetical protein
MTTSSLTRKINNNNNYYYYYYKIQGNGRVKSKLPPMKDAETKTKGARKMTEELTSGSRKSMKVRL